MLHRTTTVTAFLAILIMFSGLTNTDRVLGSDNTIENQWLSAQATTAPAGFELTARDGQKMALRTSWKTDQVVTARVEATEHAVWGSGKRLVLTTADGATMRLTLFEKLPFAVVQDEWTNTSAEPQWITRREFARFTVDLKKPADELQAFGTFGVSPIKAKDNPGSHNHLALVEPNTRGGAVLAWLTHERGSGVFFYETNADGQVTVSTRQDYGHVRLPAGKRETSETLLIGLFDDARLGLESYADAVTAHYQIKLPPEPTVYCTWYHAGASNEKQLKTQTDFAAEKLKPFGFSVVQIDDGWQDGQSNNGPRKVFVRHNPKGPYPNGMKATADYIRQQGFVAGIWYMPFAGTHDDPYFADKQDWFAQKDGKPFDTHWGGTCLDMTNPKARELTRLRTERICQDWGYHYIKIDGLWTGSATVHRYINEGYNEDNIGETTLHNPEMSNLEAYRAGLKTVRQAAGPETFILGCNTAQNMRTLGGSFGYVDAMRIGPDNGRKWSDITRGPFSGSNLYFLHRRVWYNDPDPIYVRASVPLEHARALVSWVTLAGQLHASSIYFAELPEERLDLLRRAMPSHMLRPRPVDLFERRIPRVWLLTDDRTDTPRYVVGLFNWEEKEPVTIEEGFARIGLPEAKQYAAFDYWANRFLRFDGGQLNQTIPAASCRILAVRPMIDRPQLISTSRHITQGVVDVVEEHWNAEAKSLRGTSKVVGNDPYELRIARPTNGTWSVADVSVSQADREAGVKIELVSATGDEQSVGWRVRIDSPTNREVQWAVGF